MYDILPVFGFFMIPVLTFPVKTAGRGLLTGLFLSLFFWGNLHPLLYAVSLSAAAYLFFSERKKSGGRKETLYILNPTLPMLFLFMAAMSCLTVLYPAVLHYGAYLLPGEKILAVCRALAFPAWLTGPLLCGLRCDRKGPYGTAFALTLLTETAVLLAAFGGQAPALFLAGCLLLNLCISAFFALMPALAEAFLGKENFLRFYPVMILFCTALLFIADSGRKLMLPAENPAAPLLSLTFLSFISACFLYIVWKKRLVLASAKKRKA